MEKHINVVAALHIGLSIFGIVFAMIIGLILSLIGGFIDDPVATRVLQIGRAHV